MCCGRAANFFITAAVDLTSRPNQRANTPSIENSRARVLDSALEIETPSF